MKRIACVLIGFLLLVGAIYGCSSAPKIIKGEMPTKADMCSDAKAGTAMADAALMIAASPEASAYWTKYRKGVVALEDIYCGDTK